MITITLQVEQKLASNSVKMTVNQKTGTSTEQALAAQMIAAMTVAANQFSLTVGGAPAHDHLTGRDVQLPFGPTN